MGKPNCKYAYGRFNNWSNSVILRHWFYIIESSVNCLTLLLNQLIAYLDKNDLMPVQQSGFRRNHSTETLLLRLLSDFYGAMDRGQVTLLALFDVSSAFDSVDHSVLLQRLFTSFGLSDQPLEWLRSFLSDRTNCVVLGSSGYLWVPAPFGVPQGSVFLANLGSSTLPSLHSWHLSFAVFSGSLPPTLCRWRASIHALLSFWGCCCGWSDVLNGRSSFLWDGFQPASLKPF